MDTQPNSVISLLSLEAPIDPRQLAAFGPELDDLQGNILKGHGRPHTAHIFLKFHAAETSRVREWIRNSIAPAVTSATRQLGEVARYKELGIPGGMFVGFMLSAAGYRALGLELDATADEAFLAGMRSRGGELNDPPVTDWESGYSEEIHAMLLLAHGDKRNQHDPRRSNADDVDRLQLDEAVERVVNEVKAFAAICGVERGHAIYNARREGIEHFGYVDGVSQPLFFADEVDREHQVLRERSAREARDSGQPDTFTVRWDSGAAPGLVLVKDPLGGPQALGSYMVFRKLEQNVRTFRDAEDRLADMLGLKGEDRELAGAMLVGRFENGTPVTLRSDEELLLPVPNNFNYDDDTGTPPPLRCPFQGHIRKTNPRLESAREFGLDPKEELAHRIARRGIPYGVRTVEPKAEPKLDEMPTDGVGLLFMCFQRTIGNQFEFIQRMWCNNEGFLKPGTGIDPLIGQPAGNPTGHQWPQGSSRFVGGHVKLKGGEYFFAPSISFLRSVGMQTAAVAQPQSASVG
jgi:Dyp-type peroxidase family